MWNDNNWENRKELENDNKRKLLGTEKTTRNLDGEKNRFETIKKVNIELQGAEKMTANEKIMRVDKTKMKRQEKVNTWNWNDNWEIVNNLSDKNES